MVSDVFWTGLFTFGGGVVGAASGFLTARLRQQVEADHLTLDKQRHASEEAHRHQERDDELCAQRRTLYLRYLGAFDALHTRLNGSEMTGDELFDVWSAMIQVDNEIELLGGKAVKDASYPAAEYFAKLVTELQKIITDASVDWYEAAPALRRKDSMGKEMLEVRGDLVKQMRLDLQEEKPPANAA